MNKKYLLLLLMTPGPSFLHSAREFESTIPDDDSDNSSSQKEQAARKVLLEIQERVSNLYSPRALKGSDKGDTKGSSEYPIFNEIIPKNIIQQTSSRGARAQSNTQVIRGLIEAPNAVTEFPQKIAQFKTISADNVDYMIRLLGEWRSALRQLENRVESMQEDVPEDLKTFLKNAVKTYVIIDKSVSNLAQEPVLNEVANILRIDTTDTSNKMLNAHLDQVNKALQKLAAVSPDVLITKMGRDFLRTITQVLDQTARACKTHLDSLSTLPADFDTVLNENRLTLNRLMNMRMNYSSSYIDIPEILTQAINQGLPEDADSDFTQSKVLLARYENLPTPLEAQGVQKIMASSSVTGDEIKELVYTHEKLQETEQLVVEKKIILGTSKASKLLRTALTMLRSVFNSNKFKTLLKQQRVREVMQQRNITIDAIRAFNNATPQEMARYILADIQQSLKEKYTVWQKACILVAKVFGKQSATLSVQDTITYRTFNDFITTSAQVYPDATGQTQEFLLQTLRMMQGKYGQLPSRLKKAAMKKQLDATVIALEKSTADEEMEMFS